MMFGSDDDSSRMPSASFSIEIWLLSIAYIYLQIHICMHSACMYVCVWVAIPYRMAGQRDRERERDRGSALRGVGGLLPTPCPEQSKEGHVCVCVSTATRIECRSRCYKEV